MEIQRVLFVTQEMNPFLGLTEMAEICRRLPQVTQESGLEIRILMPRFGNINERRNRLHEVVRLSGINIIIDDEDFPLIIKVASLPGVRIQVYFLDNDEFFNRKFVFRDASKKFYEDNGERAIFFCKGVFETVKKFGWPPDVIHVHGWMASLMPFLLKNVYYKDPVYANSKIVTSLYNDGFEESLGENFSSKLKITDTITDDALSVFSNLKHENIIKAAVEYSDAIIEGDAEIANSEMLKEIANNKPWLEFINNEEYPQKYLEFYKSLYQ
jgi:starch synthase